jgi:hypothetical protein
MTANEHDLTDRRQFWTFQYKPVEVQTAAKDKVTHHTERGDFWTQEYAKAEKQLKEKGFEYRERQSSYETQVQIVGDPELAQRVTDCRRKIAEHREMQKLYETWVKALKAKTERQPGEELALTINDVVFFGL